MNVGELIGVLERFPSDCNVFLGDCFCNCTDDVFAVYHDGDDVVLCNSAGCVEGVEFLKENTEYVWFNIYDSFTLYDGMTGDYVNYKDDELNTIFENLNSDICSCSDFEVYKSDDFLTVGGLKKFFGGVPNGTLVNIIIRDGEEYGVVNSIQKFDVEYLTGSIDNVDYVNSHELGLVVGLKLFGTDESLKLDESSLLESEDEVKKLIASRLQIFFETNGKILSDDEKREWSNVVSDIYENLKWYYDMYRKVNGSVDSNGLIHLQDVNEPFKKFKEE